MFDEAITAQQLIIMQLDTTILYHALPVLLILLIAEAVYMIKEHRHDNKDMLVSIVLALSALPLSLVINGAVLFTYSLIYEFRLFAIPDNFWWAWVICFFADDLSYYWYHRLSHKIRFLWASHKVHHSSEMFSLSAGLRVPWTSNITGTFLFWAWMPLIGIAPYMVIFMKSASVIYQFWMHTETISKMPKWYEAIFNTPSHHRVHHSSNVEYLDKNHAGTLIIWDKIFNTYQEEITKPTYGLAENIKSSNPFIIQFHEWRNLFYDFKKTKKLSHRIRYIFNSPGWSHDGSTKTTNQLQSQQIIEKIATAGNKKIPDFRLLSVLIITGCLLYTNTHAQERKLNYDVIRNGNIIGNVSLVELIKDQKKFVSLTADVHTNLILSFTNYTSESAAYQDGVMIYSSYYQKQNGSEKTNKKTIASGECYKLIEGGVIKSIACSPINYNMLLLYTNIPSTVTKVYSNNHQKHLDLKKVEENKYRLTLPDGNYNFYTYNKGVCSKVDIKRSLYTIQFVLRDKNIN